MSDLDTIRARIAAEKAAELKERQRIKRYANHHGWSDIDPYEVVSTVSATTAEIRPMQYIRDPEWTPEVIPGGFAGHCTNQHNQQWYYRSNPDAPVTRIRWSKAKQRWQDKHGRRFVMADQPRKFHDYNF